MNHPYDLYQVVSDKALLHLNEVETQYRLHVMECGASVRPKGLLRARCFAVNFPIGAMTLALGKEHENAAERVYRNILKKVFHGIFLWPQTKILISKEVLKEQTRALNAEYANVGAGQYALAAIYERALTESAGKLKESFDVSGTIGKTVGEGLAVWAEVYRQLSDRPMQVYTEGFTPTARDAKRLGED